MPDWPGYPKAPEPLGPDGQPAGQPGQGAGLGPPWGSAGFLDAHLLDQRVVRLWGKLDDSAVSRACAELMALDATGDSAVALYVGSCDGPIDAALSIVDTIDLLGVPVNITALGRAEGAAVGIVASGARRLAAPHSQFHLSEPQVTVSGSATQLAAWAEHHRSQVERYVARLAAATRRQMEHVEADLSIGRWLSADDAVAYGLVDEVWAPGPRPSSGAGQDGPERPFGFGPRGT
ncbi:MAG TPA: ATP-dependent Clp protease proteolytic subunit [Acidimicrobiales bacterium]|nr:ATP-dependent Clp protease proteolytic subunit [Acidimicrobiales bacterium]